MKRPSFNAWIKKHFPSRTGQDISHVIAWNQLYPLECALELVYTKNFHQWNVLVRSIMRLNDLTRYVRMQDSGKKAEDRRRLAISMVLTILFNSRANLFYGDSRENRGLEDARKVCAAGLTPLDNRELTDPTALDKMFGHLEDYLRRKNINLSQVNANDMTRAEHSVSLVKQAYDDLRAIDDLTRDGARVILKSWEHKAALHLPDASDVQEATMTHIFNKIVEIGDGQSTSPQRIVDILIAFQGCMRGTVSGTFE